MILRISILKVKIRDWVYGTAIIIDKHIFPIGFTNINRIITKVSFCHVRVYLIITPIIILIVIVIS